MITRIKEIKLANWTDIKTIQFATIENDTLIDAINNNLKIAVISTHKILFFVLFTEEGIHSTIEKDNNFVFF